MGGVRPGSARPRLAGIAAAVVLVPCGWWLVRRQRLQSWPGLSPLHFRMTALIGILGGVGILFGVRAAPSLAPRPMAGNAVAGGAR